MQINFSKDSNWQYQLRRVYTYRFKETPPFIQEDDHIRSGVNPTHPEGFDNISLLSPQPCAAGVKASLRCAFEGLGCPEIIIVEKPEKCEDGAVRYGACFEVVLYKNGVNVWRHFMDEADHRCYWHKRLGLKVPVAENQIHQLDVEVTKDSILFAVDGISVQLRTEDLPETFYVGVTGCEGIVRLYDLEID